MHLPSFVLFLPIHFVTYLFLGYLITSHAVGYFCPCFVLFSFSFFVFHLSLPPFYPSLLFSFFTYIITKGATAFLLFTFDVFLCHPCWPTLAFFLFPWRFLDFFFQTTLSRSWQNYHIFCLWILLHLYVFYCYTIYSFFSLGTKEIAIPL